MSVRTNRDRCFVALGDLLTTPELTANSPWLNQSSSIQRTRGLTDEVTRRFRPNFSHWCGLILWECLAERSAVANPVHRLRPLSLRDRVLDQSRELGCGEHELSDKRVFTFTDSSAAAGSKRFYRSVLLP